MILQNDREFLLQTKNTAYLFHVLPTGHLEHLWYGDLLFDASETEKAAAGFRTRLSFACAALAEKQEFAPGNTISYSAGHPNVCLENLCLEMSSYGKGDVREPLIELQHDDGVTVCDFLFDSAEIIEGKKDLETLPSSYGASQSLILTLKEKSSPDLTLFLTYSVFPDCDVITRSAKLVRSGHRSAARIQRPCVLKKLMSTQLDFQRSDFRMVTFTGHWTREMDRTETAVRAGRYVNESVCGLSSNRANPFVMLEEPGCTEETGSCYGLNLIYSGNHYESLSVGSFGKTRFVSGINPDCFSWELMPGDSFEAPEAVMVFSDKGRSGMSLCMHEFVREHIVRGKWQHRERPILLNSWEASYFRFNEATLLRLARSAKEAGIELFVLDDGWFGTRNDDTQSLGDWTVNTKKLPGGLRELSSKINGLGMMFGIWVEPEMVNENSGLYREHPDWAVNIPDRSQSLGRSQMILDLTRHDVCDYVTAAMENVFRSGNISYVKWDMNRIFSDAFSQKLPAGRQGEFFHRYSMGLYGIMKKLTEEFPEILFEGCASGGNRFDLGILSCFPQIWGSDDSDAIRRLSIQRGYSYGYPASAVGAHVSACPNHQTMRSVPLETRFDVAAFGAFGYELNLTELPERDRRTIREQIEFYKKWRPVFQYGDYFRLDDGKWMAVSRDRSRAVGCFVRREMEPNTFFEEFRTQGLDENALYHVTSRAADHCIEDFGSLINAVAPVHVRQDSMMHHAISRFVKADAEKEDCLISGRILNRCGLRLKMGYGGTGFNENTRIMKDFDSRLYLFERQKKI
jgi:alpha-galactosidase